KCCYQKNPYLFKKDNSSEWLNLISTRLVPLVDKLSLTDYRKNIVKKLETLGDSTKDPKANFFISWQISLFIVVFISNWLLLSLFTSKSLPLAFLFAMIAYFVPFIKITEKSSIVTKACNGQLPFFIDFLSLTMGAGLDFNNALESVITSSKKSPLTDEFQRVMRDIKLGSPRKDALLKMDQRMNVPSLRLFIHTLVQGIELGTDMLGILSNLSQIFQTKKFQKAEDDAGKISVQMMIPMMVFVMPSVMIILLGPLVLQYATQM
ncbi:MAG: type II secretion system F family protein, partial [Deltaproteobacteria bacterium]